MTSSTAASKPTSRHAHFPVNLDQETKRNEKILTIRYGKNQMALIRKRLRVEAWLYDSLEMLTGEHQETKEEHSQRVEERSLNGNSSAEIDIEVDQILDVEGDCERRQWLEEKLKGCSASREIIQKFIDEFLDRLKTL